MQDQPSENNHRVKHNAHLVDGFGAHDGLVLAVEIAALWDDLHHVHFSCYDKTGGAFSINNVDMCYPARHPTNN